MVDKHATLTFIKVRVNQAPFMTKELNKCIMNRSKVINKYSKWPFRSNLLACKKVKSLCNVFLGKAKNNIFQKIAFKETMTNREFCNAVKLFLTIKSVREMIDRIFHRKAR